MNYTLAYDFDSQLNCGIIRFNDKHVLMDFTDLFSIINIDKNFIHYYVKEKLYPFYLRHNQKITYLEHMFKYDSSNIEYVFKNGNNFDLRRENIRIYHKYHNEIVNNYEILEYTIGHYNEIGKDAYIVKNSMWKISENGNIYWLMYCETHTICKLCPESYRKILDYELQQNDGKKMTFFCHANGYISSSVGLFIHQIITGCHGNGKGTKNISVDHIDQDPLNNTMANLRIATRKEQEQNSKGIKDGTKRERKHSAQELPEGITQEMMKKYVVYYTEWLDKERTKKREFFKVEKHPKLDKHWMSSKSNKISIHEKLKHANKIVINLENDIYPEKECEQLPKYVSLVNVRGKSHLVFEKNHNEKRMNLKMVLPENYDIHQQVMMLKIRVREKYGSCLIGNDNLFNYIYDTTIDDKITYVNKITFDIFRCSCNKRHTLVFETPKTERDAIIESEKWLSEKVTEEYLNNYITNCDNIQYSNFNQTCYCCKTNYHEHRNSNRGQLLSSGIFLEFIEKIEPNHIYLSTSS